MGCFSSKEVRWSSISPHARCHRLLSLYAQARHSDIDDNVTTNFTRKPDALRSSHALGTWDALGTSIRGEVAHQPLQGSPILQTHTSCISGADHIFACIFESHGTGHSNEVASFLNKSAYETFMKSNPKDRGDAYISIALRETLAELNRSLQLPQSDSPRSPRSPRVSPSVLFQRMRNGASAGALIYIDLKNRTISCAASGGLVVIANKSVGSLRKTSVFTTIADCRHQRKDNGVVSGLMGPDCVAEIEAGSSALGTNVDSISVISGGLLDQLSVSDISCLTSCLNDQRVSSSFNISNQIIQEATIQKRSEPRQTDASIMTFHVTHPKSQSSKVHPDLNKQSVASQRWDLLRCYLRFKFLRSRVLLSNWTNVGKALLRQAEANARKAEERAWIESAEAIQVARNGKVMKRLSECAAQRSEGKQINRGRMSAGGIGRFTHSPSVTPEPEIAPPAYAAPPVDPSSLILVDASLNHGSPALSFPDKKPMGDQHLKPKGLPQSKKVVASKTIASKISLRGKVSLS